VVLTATSALVDGDHITRHEPGIRLRPSIYRTSDNLPLIGTTPEAALRPVGPSIGLTGIWPSEMSFMVSTRCSARPQSPIAAAALPTLTAGASTFKVMLSAVLAVLLSTTTTSPDLSSGSAAFPALISSMS